MLPTEFTIGSNLALAAPEEPIPNPVPEDLLKRIVERYSAQYGLSPEMQNEVLVTLKCENPERDTLLQSRIKASGPNGREDSWGLPQYFLPAKNTTPRGEVITKEMAQDPHIAVESMVWEFSRGNAKKWSCYKMHFGFADT